MVIIPENTKGPFIHSPQPIKPPVGSPPSYGSSLPYPSSSQPYPHTYFPSQAPNRQSVGRRFCRAFTIAVVIWFLFSVLIKSFVILVNWSHHGSVGYQIPLDINLGHCVSGSQWSSTTIPSLSFPYAAETSFDLPLSSDAHLLIARGPLSAGVVDVVTSRTLTDTVRVNVVVQYFRQDVRDSADVCLIKRKDNENGVGIFTSSWGRWRREEKLHFETTVIFPESSHIKSFETDLPNTPQQIGNLKDKVDFKSVALKGSNAPIRVHSLYADHTDLTTSNGPIEGSFNSSRSLSLKTSNAPIIVRVGLENDVKGPSTELIMRTSNGKIDSDVRLVSTNSTGGAFSVTARTSNGALGVAFPIGPADSTLDLTATTSNARANVRLHASYEGTFSVRTSNFSPTLTYGNVKDPAGRGRKRTVEEWKEGKEIEGRVHWGEGKGKGTVEVRTSNSPAVLEL